MRYIVKNSEPCFMTDWKRRRAEAGQELKYGDFDKKKELNDLLRLEQHHVCCYCQKKLTHFQGEKIGGAHNEHLVPQVDNSDIQMDYTNIYACCVESQGNSRDKQHCGESKGRKSIRLFIQDRNCSEYFKYNIIGEILPNGKYNTWSEYQENKLYLTGDIKDAYDAICVLNLNCHSLVEDRKGDCAMFLKVLSGKSVEWINDRIDSMQAEECFERYIDMLLYYMRKRI